MTLLDTDLAALVGELETLACEHSQHGSHPNHTDEPASHYVMAHCPGCTIDPIVYPACPGWIQTIARASLIRCRTCGTTDNIATFLTILGPVRNTK